MEYFSIRFVLFEVWGYPMSYIELFGTVAGAIAVWLSAQGNKWGWPIGLINIIFFFIIFFQVQLYPDMLLQIFFFITNLIGWWKWTHPASLESDRKKELKVSFVSIGRWPLLLLTGICGTAVLGYLAAHIHIWLPVIFHRPSAFPYLDSFVTVMSILATFMMVQKKIECWIVWIVVDLIATGMYFSKNIKLIGVEYLVFFLIATFGLWNWSKIYRSYST